ncbi:MAG: ParB N-terminal domain-containing protein [Lachnospiraceae bacterium]|nr:ParB N-terminal domain-containing protein [Lachnospiraceae bacterium]
MASQTRNLQQRIKNDIESYHGNPDTVKPGVLEKMGTKKVPPARLHANPDDEFSDPRIGPNDSIISNYSQIARWNHSSGMPVYEEPIMVNKLRQGDYLILNGHHRWAGALQANVPTVRIKILDPDRQ